MKNCKNCFCIAFCPNCVEGAKKHCEENNSQRCAQLRIAAEDYRNEQTLGHQVQSYKPKSKNKFEKLPENIELFFSKDVSEMVSNKLPGYQDSELRYLTFLYKGVLICENEISVFFNICIFKNKNNYLLLFQTLDSNTKLHDNLHKHL